MSKEKESNNHPDIKNIDGDDLIPVPDDPFVISEIVPVRKVIDMYLEWAIRNLGGNKEENLRSQTRGKVFAKSAKTLGVSMKTIYNRINSGELNV